MLFEGSHNSKRPKYVLNKVAELFKKNLYGISNLAPKMNLEK